MLDKKKIAVIIGGATVVISGATALALTLKKKKDTSSWAGLGDLDDDFDDSVFDTDEDIEDEDIDDEDYDDCDDCDGCGADFDTDDVDDHIEKGCPFDEDIYNNHYSEKEEQEEDKGFGDKAPDAFTHLLKNLGVKDEKLLSDIEKATEAIGTATEKTCDASKEVLIKGLEKVLKTLKNK